MSGFDFACRWLNSDASSEVDATRAQIGIKLGGRQVSAFNSAYGEKGEELEIPAYYIAEWIAENWWPLLWEPRKVETLSEDAADFLSRHWLISAEHGFALPSLLFVSLGHQMSVSATARDAAMADVRFLHSAKSVLDRNEVEGALGRFVQKVVDRLGQSGIQGTDLQTVWSAISSTQPDEETYCQLVGSLGLSPYNVVSSIDTLVFEMVEKYGEAITRDLCFVSRPDDFAKTARIARLAMDLTRNAAKASLKPLADISMPADMANTPAWQRGVQAAKRLRAGLNIADADPRGSEKILSVLEVDIARPANTKVLSEGEADPAIVGAVVRDGWDFKPALVQPFEAQRRFAAARAIYTGWAAPQQTQRLLTRAVTREQQASRAFAAEITAPLALLKSRAKRWTLESDAVNELADMSTLR